MADLQILYEDNHLLIVNKPAGMLVQGDSTGDTPLSELVERYLIERYDKPGRAFVGVTHRIDRPTSGAVLFAKTSKALARLNAMFQRREIHKVYHAVVCGTFPQKAGEAKDLLYRNRKQNKSYVVTEQHAEAKRAWLSYERLAVGDRPGGPAQAEHRAGERDEHPAEPAEPARAGLEVGRAVDEDDRAHAAEHEPRVDRAS